MATLGEIAAFSSTKDWSETGKNRLVKVMDHIKFRQTLSFGTVMGYVTQEKFLYGKTPAQIETLLGVRPNEFRAGCHIVSLARLPKTGEYEFKLSTAFPDGEAFGQKQWKQHLAAREDFAKGQNLYTNKDGGNRAFNPVVQSYPPGSSMVPQWKIIKAIELGGIVCTLYPNFQFPRENGSITPYQRYNKHEIKPDII